MAENPYFSSSPAEIEWTMPPQGGRPVGISILAVLQLLGGLALFVAQFALLANLQALEEVFRLTGIPPALVLIGMMFLAALGIASGIGLWTGAKWGWWLGAFYYVYSIFRNLSALAFVVMMAEELAGGSRGTEYYLFKHMGRIVISGLLLLYFFKGNVLQFFGLERLNKLKALGILVSICIAIAAASSTIGLLLN